jgi:NAD(P)-dependent dehydrogenase (short-subunit alcohol dehydrogenase family)
VTAEVFAREGAKVLVADISGEEEAVAERIGPSAVACRVDVTREDQIEAMFAKALDSFGRIDASVHLAGPPGGRRGEEVTLEEYEAVAGVHLGGMMFCTKHAVRAMLPNGGGSIVNFSSCASLNADRRISPVYGAAKAGVNSMTKAFALQYGPQGVRVNAIAPGFTLSEKNQAVPPELMPEMTGKASLKRGAHPEEQAQVAAFLCSDRASFVTGTIIPVDGGWSSRLA